MIPDETISQIRERVDIVELVGEYVRLSKSGTSFKGLCPFHAEKTASFYVHPRRRFFHCFGCQASGDVFSFLTRLEGLAFPEAAARLALKAGVEIPTENTAEAAERKRRRRKEEGLADLIDAAAGFFAKALKEHPLAHIAQASIAARGLTPESVETFRLGYAPHSWDALVSFLRERGVSPQEAESVGLIVPRRQRGYYDRFRHRLMFPISDHQGRIVAFSGRLLPLPEGESDSREPGAKYINSPEGPLYTKGEVLFGLHEGRVQIRRTGTCLLCEGNFDLVKLHQAGFQNAVAPMGTALTDKQANLLKRFADHVVLLFDGDKAGRKAVISAYPLLARAGLRTSVVALPAGADPDSFLSDHGVEALRTRVESAPPIVEYLIDQGADESAGDPGKKAAAIEALGPILSRIDNPVEARLYVERVAQKFEVRDIEAVRQQLRRGLRASRSRRAKRRVRPQEGGRSREGGAPNRETRRQAPSGPHEQPWFEGQPGPEESYAPHERDDSRRAGESQEARRAPPKKVDPVEGALLGALLDQPRLFHDPLAQTFAEVLTDPDLRGILEACSQLVGDSGELETAALIAEIGQNSALGWLEGRLVHPTLDDEDSARQVLEANLPRLEQRRVQRQFRLLTRASLDARAQGDDARADELMREAGALQRTLIRP